MKIIKIGQKQFMNILRVKKTEGAGGFDQDCSVLGMTKQMEKYQLHNYCCDII